MENQISKEGWKKYEEGKKERIQKEEKIRQEAINYFEGVKKNIAYFDSNEDGKPSDEDIEQEAANALKWEIFGDIYYIESTVSFLQEDLKDEKIGEKEIQEGLKDISKTIKEIQYRKLVLEVVNKI